MTQTGILLFAHGSRDALWRTPFTAIRKKVIDQHDGPVSLAFLEHMRPNFIETVDDLVQNGASTIRVVPLFLAAGGHVRGCIPKLLEQAKQQHPTVTFTVLSPLGESETLLNAFADFAMSAPQHNQLIGQAAHD